jgi:hypothetical protein
MTVWLLGIKPSRRGQPALVPKGGRASTADRLRSMLGLTVDEFLSAFPNRENVMDRVNGRRLAKRVTGTAYVFGREAWRCLDFPPRDFFQSHGTGGAVFFLLPHPSGRCRNYNSEIVKSKLRRLMCRHLSSRSTSPTTASTSRVRGSTDHAVSR